MKNIHETLVQKQKDSLTQLQIKQLENSMRIYKLALIAASILFLAEAIVIAWLIKY